MRDDADRESTGSLERPRRLRPFWRRRLARLAVIGLGLAVIAQSADRALVDGGRDCATAMREKAWASAVQICQLEFQRTQDSAIGARLAEAQRKAGHLVDARRTASLLLLTSARPDALYQLGVIAQMEDRTEDAIPLLEGAREAHRNARRWKELAQDAGVLAMARTARSEFAEALRLADECITHAQLAGDSDVEHYCRLGAAKTFVRVGHWPAADQELQRAKQLSIDKLQRSDDEYLRGSQAQEVGDYATAIAFYKNALELRGGSSGDDRWIINTQLNLAYSLAERRQLDEAQQRRQLDEAQQYLQAATALDVDGVKVPERVWTEARIAYRQRDLARATALNEEYGRLRNGDDAFDRDDRLDVATLQARIELERGDLGSAERWARQGVTHAEVVRDAQSALELRPWVLAKRREPYELLFTALARGGQVEEAAMAFDDWQGRTVQDALAKPHALAAPHPPAAPSLRDAANQLARLGGWLRVASQATFARRDRTAVLRTMREIDVLALIVADGEVWRLTASHGPPRLVPLGSLAQLQAPLDELLMNPTAPRLADQFGALLVPDEAFRARGVLHVVVDSRLGSLPVAALRHGGTPLIEVRPIVRALRFPERRCVLAPRPGHATVLGVASATIPNAVAEADEVARLLHATSATGAAATKDALFAAASDAVLHVAAHAVIGLDGAALVLADGEVSALEISARGVAPALAVLSACHAAVSDDGELGGSLAAAFLGAGSRHVVATLRPISDAGARDITTRFYRADGVADPVRALATVQAALAKTGDREWPYFAVFGSAVCRDGAPDRE